MPEFTGKSSHRQRRGFALLIVMILIVLLAVLVMAFQHDVAREISVTRNVRSDLEADYLAQMALVRGQVILRLDEHAEYDSLNEPWAQAMQSWEGETFGADDVEGSENTEQPTPPQILISDEERKFNLLNLVRGNELQRERAAQVLTRLIDIVRREDPRLEGWLDGDVKTVRRAGDEELANTDTLIKNLVRYLEERASEDADDLEMTVNPSEAPDVRSMKKQTPYEMLTVGELLQVEGWSDDLLYGSVRRATEDSNVYSRDEERDEEEESRDWKELTEEEKFTRKRQIIEEQDQRSADPNPLPLINFITLYSTGAINVNTAPREVLLALDEKLTWEVVDKIITARDQDRVNVAEAEEAGTDIPPSFDEEEPPPEEGAEEEEDKASFRPQDLANYQAFLQRLQNQEVQEGEQPEPIENFNEEIYNAIRPWLTVVSSVFSVEASATVGKVTHTIRAIYRRSGSNPDTSTPQPTGEGEQPAQPAEGEATTEDGLPPQPEIKLTLLLRDVTSGR